MQTHGDGSWKRSLLKVERAAQDIDSADELTERVGQILADTLEADAHVFLRLDPLTALWMGAAGQGYDPQACAYFAEHVFLKSPLADYGAAAREGERVRLLSPDTTDDEAYAKLYFRGLGHTGTLQASFATGGQTYGHLTLSRRAGPFAAEAARLVDSAIPPVTHALRRLLAKETLEAAPGEGAGLLFVDAQGQLTAANELGEQILARARAADPWQTRGTLAAIAELARRELVAPSGKPLPRAVYLEPHAGRRYRLVAERMRPLAGGPPHALIMAEPIRALDSVELLRTAGLSEREAEVALVMLRGFKSAEGAAALGMSEHTLLSHLKSVYKKLGVSSRGELASLILSGV